jgi:hypothetical protein
VAATAAVSAPVPVVVAKPRAMAPMDAGPALEDAECEAVERDAARCVVAVRMLTWGSSVPHTLGLAHCA